MRLKYLLMKAGFNKKIRNKLTQFKKKTLDSKINFFYTKTSYEKWYDPSIRHLGLYFTNSWLGKNEIIVKIHFTPMPYQIR